MAQVQRERNLREINSPSTCGLRRAATIVSVIGRGCQVWLSLRIQYRYRSSLDRSCISRDSLVVATQSQRGGRSFLPPLLSDQPGQPPPSDRKFCTPGITCTRRKTQARVRNNEIRSQRMIGRIVALAGLSLSLLPACPRPLERHQPPPTHHTPHTHPPTNHALLSFFLFPRCPSHPEHPFSLYLHRPLASNSIASNSIEYSIRGFHSQTSLDRECIDSRESSLSLPPAHTTSTQRSSHLDFDRNCQPHNLLPYQSYG